MGFKIYKDENLSLINIQPIYIHQILITNQGHNLTNFLLMYHYSNHP